ncbi:hypothetical protein TCDM_05058 [Trypanosoma cruzi Dm28c]|uniref:Clu domain-containing protein n=1 Tax=Trypanosoma cruzi Dm28c TaxID=1416333 RepID=V5BP08_TRYCR|nr:hypothetical protein TCDM_05058 [Trypanosoma cruzi Dm28c]
MIDSPRNLGVFFLYYTLISINFFVIAGCFIVMGSQLFLVDPVSPHMVRLPPQQQRGGRRVTAARVSNASAPLQPPVVAAAQVAASASSETSVVYWQLLGASASLHQGPLGDVVGVVPCGTVIREVRRYMDPFGSWWVALKANDGDILWALLSTERETEISEEQARWQKVYNERLLPQGFSETDRQEEARVLRRAVIPVETNSKAAPSKDVAVHDVRVFEECWHNFSAVTNRGRDWNAEYQRLVELILFEKWEKSVSASEELQRFMGQFLTAAEEAALSVIADMLRPSSDRVAKGPIFGSVGSFLYNDLLVKLAIDDGSGNTRGDTHAWRQASQTLQAMRLIALEGPRRLLYSPPSVLITFTGFRCSVMAIPPVEVKNIVYLSLEERGSTLDAPEFVRSQLMDLGQALNLKQHHLRPATGDVVTLSTPLGMAVVAGRDKRLYLINTSRLIPACVFVTSTEAEADEAVIPRFRPEFLLSYGKPLSSDSFVKDAATPEDNADVVEATEWIRDEVIPAVAAMIGFLRAVDVPRQDPVECRLCSHTMENELRFVVCHSIDMCCCICSHCYTQRLSEDKKDNLLFCDAVKCDTAARSPKGLLIEPPINSIFHANGLNMRFLPFVYYRLPYVSRFAVAHYLEIEMIARTAVRLLRDKLRRTAQSVDEVKIVCQEFLLGLLQSSGAKAKHFWAHELGPALESLYGVQMPFDTSEIDVELLYHRVAQLSGVHLHMASVASLHTEKPYLQLAEVRPLIKAIHPPLLVDEASHEKRRAALLQCLEGILLFWIGFSANGNDDGDVDSAQPFYMTERESWM